MALGSPGDGGAKCIGSRYSAMLWVEAFTFRLPACPGQKTLSTGHGLGVSMRSSEACAALFWWGTRLALRCFLSISRRLCAAVATPFWSLEFPEFVLPPDFGARLRDLSPIYLYRSRDDREIPAEHLERYRRALPHATVRVLEGRGHEFNQAEFPELVADIRDLESRRAG
jgi:pimeloyl-ACP methyl ester carboxylesterase